MQRTWRKPALLSATVALLLVTLLAPGAGGAAPVAGTAAEVRTISTVGQANLDVAPDRAVVSLGVNVSAPTPGESYAEATAIMNRIVDSMWVLGILPDQVQTAQLSLHEERRNRPKASRSAMPAPRLVPGMAAADMAVKVMPVAVPAPLPVAPPGPIPPPPPGPPLPPEQEEVITYRTIAQLRVNTADLAGIGKLVDVALQAGANSLQGVSFTVVDQEKHVQDAIDKAVDDAKAKAARVAGRMGLEVSRPRRVNVSVGTSGRPYPVPYAKAAYDMAIPAPAPMPVLSGKVPFAVTVNVDFELK